MYAIVLFMFITSISCYTIVKEMKVDNPKDKIYQDVVSDDQFVQIYFRYNFRDELNTFENYLQKKSIRVKFSLTEEEQNKILEKAKAIDFFSIPDRFSYVYIDSAYSIEIPTGRNELRIKHQMKDKTIHWSFPSLKRKVKFKGILELCELILSILESRPEYKRLPATQGGYL